MIGVEILIIQYLINSCFNSIVIMYFALLASLRIPFVQVETSQKDSPKVCAWSEIIAHSRYSWMLENHFGTHFLVPETPSEGQNLWVEDHIFNICTSLNSHQIFPSPSSPPWGHHYQTTPSTSITWTKTSDVRYVSVINETRYDAPTSLTLLSV